MGDFSSLNVDELCSHIISTYDTSHIIVITSAPPCKDHSRSRDEPPGTDGADGSHLAHMTTTHQAIQQGLPEYQIRSLMENVIPHRNIQDQFQTITQQWGTPPAVVDAADGQVTSRPRLWWNDIDWQEVQCRLTQDIPFTLHWTTQNTYDQLHNPIATLIQPPVHIKERKTPAILCQHQLFHCLTTQAPTDLGRPPPKHVQADESTWDRWQQDNRQFPPWQYQPQFLTRPHEGDLQPITPLQPEPDHFTQITPDHPSTRTRNTMVGNAWHFPSALWLLFLLLLFYLQDHPFQHHHYKQTFKECPTFGWHPRHPGDHHPNRPHPSTCHSSTGPVTSDGPVPYRNPCQTTPDWIPAYVGLSNRPHYYRTSTRSAPTYYERSQA